MEGKKRNYSRRAIALALVLLLGANVLMGLVLLLQSRRAVRTQINQRMLDIANTAALMLDGDIMRELQAEDEGTEQYTEELETLRHFQDSIALEYIYGIRQQPDGSFSFTIDPAVEDPGEFGEPIVTTPALLKAASGTPAVDKKAYSDDWGRFYSAYSPIFDSEGQVAGIVGVDFDADWYDQQTYVNLTSILIITVISLILGAILASAVAGRNQRRFRALTDEMDLIGDDLQELNRIMMNSSIRNLDHLPEQQGALLKTLASGEHYAHVSEEDEVTEIGESLHKMKGTLRKYIGYINRQTYLDPMLGVGNRNAYRNAIKEVSEQIENGSGDFAVAFFDLNDLKPINVVSGFEAGDEMLCSAAGVLKSVFRQSNVFRVASDEFIVIMLHKGLLDMDEYFRKFDDAVHAFNVEKGSAPLLSVAKGFAVYNAEKHSSYRQVFVEAESNMHRDKSAYHEAAQ